MTTAHGECWQVLSDCPHCRAQGSVVELLDPTHPACHLGMPAEVRCRLCAWTVVAEPEPFPPRLPIASGRCPACQRPLDEAARSGQGPCLTCGYAPRQLLVRAPDDLRDAGRAVAALSRWAAEEGDGDVETFCVANMGGPAEAVVARLLAGEVVETTFDVVAWLFPTVAGSRGRGVSEALRPRDLVVTGDDPIVVPEPEPELAMDARTPARVLVSVMVADGHLRAGERTFVDRFLERDGRPPLDPADLRVWRPQELGPMPDPELRDRLIEAAVHLAHLDRERDGSEWKVILAFSRAWGVPDDRVHAWDRLYDQRYATAMTRLWRSLTGLVRVR